MEEFLADLWQTELGVERVGADDSFFELGGSSLTAMQVMLQLCREYDIDLPLESMFSHPVLAELAPMLEVRIGLAAYPPFPGDATAFFGLAARHARQEGQAASRGINFLRVVDE